LEATDLYSARDFEAKYSSSKDVQSTNSCSGEDFESPNSCSERDSKTTDSYSECDFE
jgi:hypothetical protein